MERQVLEPTGSPSLTVLSPKVIPRVLCYHRLLSLHPGLHGLQRGTERPEHESQTIHQSTDTFPQSSVVSYEQPWAGQEGVEWPGPLVPGLLSLMSICLLFPYSTLQDRRADPLKSIFAKLLGQQASDWLNQ